MRAKQYRGFTMVEAVVAFVLISFIAAMVSVPITSACVMATKLKEIPNGYYQAQNQVEGKIERLSSKVEQLARMQNECKNLLAGSSERMDLEDKISELEGDADLNAPTIKDTKVKLFDREVTVFKFTETLDSLGTGQSTTLYAGVVDGVPAAYRTSVIDAVTLKVEGVAKDDLYFGVGKDVKAEVQYNGATNSDCRGTEKYQWYVSTGTYHVLPFADGPHYELVDRYNTLLPTFPDDFQELANGDHRSFTVTESCKGKLLVCCVTPVSKEGAEGASKLSNYLYVSALPELSNGKKYKALFDPSLESVDYDEVLGRQRDDLWSRDLGTGQDRLYRGYINALTTTGCAVLISDRSPTLSKLFATDCYSGSSGVDTTYSRYFKIDNYAYVKGITVHRGDFVFAVVGNDNWTNAWGLKSPKDILSESGSFSRCYGNGQDGYWYRSRGNVRMIMGWQCSRDQSLRINGDYYPTDLCAELIITEDIDEDDINNILQYLSDKYNIELSSEYGWY